LCPACRIVSFYRAADLKFQTNYMYNRLVKYSLPSTWFSVLFHDSHINNTAYIIYNEIDTINELSLNYSLAYARMKQKTPEKFT
jgi:hypothetical protein